MDPLHGSNPFHSAEEEVKEQPSSSYYLAFTDREFLLREENRPIRLQLEYLKPEMIQQEHGIESTVVIFGSARINSPERAQTKLEQAELALAKDSKNIELQNAVEHAKHDLARSYYYEEARKLTYLIASSNEAKHSRHYVVVTGGGPGIMEAANRGAYDANAISIGLNILLPKEQGPNPFITPELNFQFHYFALRKMHFLLRARAAVFFPGGFGTFDELFETLTLMQTHKISRFPILLYGKEYWTKVLNFDMLIEEGMIDSKDMELFQFVDSADATWQAILDFYKKS